MNQSVQPTANPLQKTATQAQKQFDSDQFPSVLSTVAVAKSVVARLVPPKRAPFNLFTPYYDPEMPTVIRPKELRYTGQFGDRMVYRSHTSAVKWQIRQIEKNLGGMKSFPSQVEAEVKNLKRRLPLARRLDFIDEFDGGRILNKKFSMAGTFKVLSPALTVAGALGTIYDIGTASRQAGQRNGSAFGVDRNTARAIGANAGLWAGAYGVTALTAFTLGKFKLTGATNFFLTGTLGAMFGGVAGGLGYTYGGQAGEKAYDI